MHAPRKATLATSPFGHHRGRIRPEDECDGRCPDATQADRRSLEEVGQAFDITRERVRQIENRTLKKLQTLPEAQQLREAS